MHNVVVLDLVPRSERHQSTPVPLGLGVIVVGVAPERLDSASDELSVEGCRFEQVLPTQLGAGAVAAVAGAAARQVWVGKRDGSGGPGGRTYFLTSLLPV